MLELNREQQIKLLQLARKTISEKLGIDEGLNTLDLTDEIFLEKAGAFVTIHLDKNLRGCIGYIQGVKPIPETVKEVSASSAFQDPRFTPLSEKEYSHIDIEISIMSPIEDVTDIDDIVVGDPLAPFLPLILTKITNINKNRFRGHDFYKALGEKLGYELE